MKSQCIVWILIAIILLGIALLVLSRLGLIPQNRDPSDKRYMQTFSGIELKEVIWRESASFADPIQEELVL